MLIERLSERLKAVASFVEKDVIVADIGSDHAYLPCYLIQTEKVKKVIVGEVVEGPYNSAVKSVKKEGLQAQITVRLANGLFAIEESDQVHTITIAGMGGSLIASILEDGKNRLETVERIIVQPNIHAEAIREWATANRWKIIDERILEEESKIYEILVLEKGEISYSEADYLLGPILRLKKSDVFIEKWEREIEEWTRVLIALEEANETSAIEQKKEQLRHQIQLVRKALV
ncbi:tRNA (adenine(22)-N(1))-methyltransferase [Sporosarcina sp. CAU 1771]